MPRRLLRAPIAALLLRVLYQGVATIGGDSDIIGTEKCLIGIRGLGQGTIPALGLSEKGGDET